MHDIPLNALISVDDLLYKQVVTDDINEGDLVLDLGDFTFGYVAMRRGDKIAIKDDYVTELGVPIDRVRKLILTVDPRSVN